jgi:hypothetical protein
VNQDVSQVVEFLQALHDSKHPQKPPVERQTKFKGPIYKYNHQPKIRAFVIWLRFGSIHEECKPPLRTYRYISEITGVKLQSCITIVRNWRRYGYQICNFKGTYERRYWYTDEIKEYLLDP